MNFTPENRKMERTFRLIDLGCSGPPSVSCILLPACCYWSGKRSSRHIGKAKNNNTRDSSLGKLRRINVGYFVFRLYNSEEEFSALKSYLCAPCCVLLFALTRRKSMSSHSVDLIFETELGL